ncbi:hypothetical protein ACE38W_00670 [Chitinophaga sp. Hz27]|uniref:hypothetical protein n=1 Tax=Chitinophaga sp. Hz27 TaxID=3347169 RepID=UPI0035DFC2DC
MSKKMFISDQRILQLGDWLVSTGKEKNIRDFLTRIGAGRNNLTRYRDGSQGFTKEMMLRVAELYGVDLNWLFGLSTQMILKQVEQPSVIDTLKMAVMLVEQELQQKKKVDI